MFDIFHRDSELKEKEENTQKRQHQTEKRQVDETVKCCRVVVLDLRNHNLLTFSFSHSRDVHHICICNAEHAPNSTTSGNTATKCEIFFIFCLRSQLSYRIAY